VSLVLLTLGFGALFAGGFLAVEGRRDLARADVQLDTANRRLAAARALELAHQSRHDVAQSFRAAERVPAEIIPFPTAEERRA
jgi:hypothetical protein